MKVLSYILVAVISFGAAFVVCGGFDSGSNTYALSDIEDVITETKDPTEYSTYYDQLTDYQKELYNIFLKPVSKAEEKIKLTNVNIASFKKNSLKAMIAVQYDHPEYFWFTGGYSYKTSRPVFKEEGEIELWPIYYKYVSPMFNSDDKRSELEKAVKKVANYAREYSSDDYERIIYVHDYLIKNAYYDHDGLEEFEKTSHNPSCEYIFSAYGCLVEGKTVCSGYAKAFQMIMTELGYNCSYVTGDAGEAHGWNCIYLDGEGYYVDVTWDDRDQGKEIPVYEYAFINDEALNRTHTIDMEFDSPVCNATKYNFFKKRNYYLDKYDFKLAVDILSAQSKAEAAYIQFGSLEELGKAYNDIIKENKFAKIDGINKFKTFTYNSNHYTLTFFN